jgi:hypothetical protein
MDELAVSVISAAIWAMAWPRVVDLAACRAVAAWWQHREQGMRLSKRSVARCCVYLVEGAVCSLLFALGGMAIARWLA